MVQFSQEIIIKEAEEVDIKGIVSVHIKAFPYFFLTTLGPSFLNTYYSNFSKSKNTKLIIAKISNSIVGFGAACTKRMIIV